VFEGPHFGVVPPPSGISPQQLTRRGIVGLVIGAKIKSAPLACPASQTTQELPLHNPVLVVTQFWPWVREKNKDVSDSDLRRNGFEKKTCLGADEMEIA